MFRRSQGKWVLAAALASALLLAAPAQAAGWNGWVDAPAQALRAWEWLAGLWPAARPGLRGTASAPWQKEGAGVDPNGSHATGEVPPEAPAGSDTGAGVDPDG